MNSILATESTAAAEAKPAAPPTVASPAGDWMRHIPPLDWMVRKVDVDLRTRIDIVTSVFSTLGPADPRQAAVEAELRALCRTVERLSNAVKFARHNGNGLDLPARISALLTQAAAGLRTLESTTFGRRNPPHLFDRSKSEPVYAALLAVIIHVERLVQLVRTVDPGIDEQLLEGLVVLQNPIDDRMLRPIA